MAASHTEKDNSQGVLLSQQSDEEQPLARRRVGGKFRSTAATTVTTLGLVAIGCTTVYFARSREPDMMKPAPQLKTLVMRTSNAWSCQHYTDDQDDDWCMSAGTQNGHEYRFVGFDGPEAGLCSDCWCCSREVEEAETPLVQHLRQHGGSPSSSEHKEEKQQKTKEDQHPSAAHEATSPWQCHQYADDQDDSWCQGAGNQSGFEYRWVGAEANLCDECWCCKRSLVPPKKCAKTGQNCMKTKCCEQEGFQCYEQDSKWASCKSTCTEEGWNCKQVGERTTAAFTGEMLLDRGPVAVDAEGAGPGEICAVVGKCRQPGYQCYQMNDYYSACKVTCDAKDWTCKEFGERAPLQIAGGTDCAWGADICSPAGCCVAEGLQCYARDEYWASCMVGCNHSMDMGTGPEKWSCKKYGERKKVELGCTWGNEECGATKLCCHPGFSCVKKDDRRAYCTLETDLPGWDGAIIGGSHNEWPVQSVEAGSKNESGTSLYCFMAVLPGSVEEELRGAAESKGASIFACDAHDVFDSWQSAHADNGASTDGATWDSVINTDVFVNVWEQVLKRGRYKKHDWTVKVDPDAVFFADRLKYKLQQLHAPKGWPIYIKNTEKEFGFLGACEVLSVEAINKYSQYYRECFAVISAGSGEDGYIKGCMDMIGAGYMLELDVLRNPFHDGACSDPARVTFHPRKTAGEWDQCYNEAMR